MLILTMGSEIGLKGREEGRECRIKIRKEGWKEGIKQEKKK